MWDTPFNESMLGSCVIIHCPEESSVRALMRILNKYGVVWGGSQRPAGENPLWDVYKEQTCYWVEYGELSFGPRYCVDDDPEWATYTKCTFRAGCELPDLDMSGCASGSLLV